MRSVLRWLGTDTVQSQAMRYLLDHVSLLTEFYRSSFVNIYYKNNIAQRFTMMNFYMVGYSPKARIWRHLRLNQLSRLLVEQTRDIYQRLCFIHRRSFTLRDFKWELRVTRL